MTTTTNITATLELQQLLSTPPDNFQGPRNNPSAIAHASLEAIRDAGDPKFLFLRTILELVFYHGNTSQQQQQDNSSNVELLFHCITGCRSVTLMKWNYFSIPFRVILQNLFLCITSSSTTSTTTTTTIKNPVIRSACYTAAACFWKRRWKEDYNQNQHQQPSPEEQALIESIQSSYQHQQNQQLQVLQQLNTPTDLFRYVSENWIQHETISAATFLTTLIGEFAGKSASNYNMPLEFHKRAYESFEKDGWLDMSLQISMKALSRLVNTITTTGSNTPTIVVEETSAVVQLTTDIIGWEFGGTDIFDTTGSGLTSSSQTGKSLVRPPISWREYLMQPEFIKAIFHVHGSMIMTQQQQQQQSQQQSSSKLVHSLRQLLLLLASLHGPMFQNEEERKTYCSFLLEGILGLVASATNTMTTAMTESSLLLDTLSMVSRLIANYKLSILTQLPLMSNLHQGIASIGRHLLQQNLKECESVGGDLEAMQHREWSEEALALLLEGIVLLCGDPWLLYSGSEESRNTAQATLATTLGPLYAEFVVCRTRMARLEEQYFTAHEEELDEVREEIFAVDLEDEMTSLSLVGRLDLLSSLSCLSSLFQQVLPQLQSLWEGNVASITPEAAGLLEESRLLTMYLGHLLTDDNSGETPVIPDTIIVACQNGDAVANTVFSAVQTLQQFAHFQATKIAAHPGDTRLSPILAKSFLWFLNRWAPPYILPVDYGASKVPSSIMMAWSSTQAVDEAVNFCITLCLHYQCYWPHERQVQEVAATLLSSLAKRCDKLRRTMVSSSSFRQLVKFHCTTCGIRHSAPPAEFEATIHAKATTGGSGGGGGDQQAAALMSMMDMLKGYHRLPYDIKSKILTGLLIGSSEYHDDASKALLNDCLQSVNDAFQSLVHALSNNQTSPDSVDAKEMTCLCVELYGGVARAGEMVAAERIPKFLTPSLPHLSGLMAYYAKDLSICECLLRLFRDYAEQFIAVLDPESCLALFKSSADLLKSYSSTHCASSRVIAVVNHHDLEEEQNYNDILCAIELLIQLGTKDFIDIGDSGIDSSQVTDMIFFGLQQILPLMTKGLLQFPKLCAQYFSLVGFMMETYPEKVGILPYDLFDALLESLLFGMSHHDATVAKSSLQGISGLMRQHLQTHILHNHLSTPQGQGLLEKASRRLLLEVVFQSIIWDRLEAAGMALLALSAADLPKFVVVVQVITSQVPEEHQQRLAAAFDGLLQQDVLSKVACRGYEGRQNRIKFRKDFEAFCHDIHSFLVLK